MKITILNGDFEKNDTFFSTYIDDFTNKLKEKHEVELYTLNKMNLKFCTGCWSCWWKTPGKCAIKDDADTIFKSCIDSDFLIFASPLKAGFISSELKKITDRLIVLLLPYIQIINRECHESSIKRVVCHRFHRFS